MFSVYVYRENDASKINYNHPFYRVLGLYTLKEVALEANPLTDIFETEEDVLITFSVYENEWELPESVSSKIRTSCNCVALPELKKLEEHIFAVIGNMDMTEGRGPCYIKLFTNNPLLANKIAHGSGPSGGNDCVISLPINCILGDKISVEINMDKI